MTRAAFVGCVFALFALTGDAFAANAPGAGMRGERDYATYCAPCHGRRGNGDGPLAGMLVPRPARHSDAAFMSALSDDYLFQFLKQGGPTFGKSALMGAWGRTLSDAQLRDVVSFMRSLASRPGYAAQSLFFSRPDSE